MSCVVKTMLVMLLSFSYATICYADSGEERDDNTQDYVDFYEKLLPQLNDPASNPLRYSGSQDSARLDYPYWYKPYHVQEPNLDAIRMQKRRFFAFHPIARFRGIAMESGGSSGSRGGGLGSSSNPYFVGQGSGRSFSPFAPSFVASPSHPVPADARMKSLTALTDDARVLALESKDHRKKMMEESGDVGSQPYTSPYFNRIAPHRGSKGRDKISRFSPN